MGFLSRCRSTRWHSVPSSRRCSTGTWSG